MIYLALIHQDEPPGTFGVSFPDFPDCVTAATTLAEAKALAGEALFGHIAGITGISRPGPRPAAAPPGPAHRFFLRGGN